MIIVITVRVYFFSLEFVTFDDSNIFFEQNKKSFCACAVLALKVVLNINIERRMLMLIEQVEKTEKIWSQIDICSTHFIRWSKQWLYNKNKHL